jgi:hypothetical protein
MGMPEARQIFNVLAVLNAKRVQHALNGLVFSDVLQVIIFV